MFDIEVMFGVDGVVLLFSGSRGYILVGAYEIADFPRFFR